MQSPVSSTDQKLMEDLKCGSQVAFSLLFKKHWYELFRLAYSKVNSRQVAEEIVQDLFLRLWEKRESLEIKDVSRYLKKSLVHLCIDHLRRQMVHEKYWTHYRCFLPEAASPDDALLSSEMHAALRTGIASLPAKTRKVLILSKFFGFSVAEIAGRFKLSEKAVEYHLTKSVKSLRVFLKDYVLLVVGAILLLFK